MAPASVWMSGFGPFEDVGSNPSGLLVRALEGDPPAGWRVRSVLLPVSFIRAPSELDRWLGSSTERPDLLLGLGVQKEAGYRFEQCARARLTVADRPDVDGVVAARGCAEALGDQEELRTDMDLAPLLQDLATAGAVSTSNDAGGFVCERVYHHLLARAREWAVPCFFLHLPPVRHRPLAQQEAFLRRLLDCLGAERDQSS